MKRKGNARSIIILLMLAAVMVLVYTTNSRNYVVMVSADGFRWDYPNLYGTPALDGIAAEGVRTERLIPSFPSKTFPNHYTLATGLHPDNHGIINNTFWAPDQEYLYRIGDRSAVENPAFYCGEPVWATASKAGIKTASFYWVGSEAAVGGNQPDYWKTFDSSVSFEARIDTVIKWLSYPVRKRPGFITLYFEEPDGVAHNYGPVSDSTRSGVRRIDNLMATLDARLKELKIGKRVNLIFLSDHGMTPQGEGSYLNLKEHIPEYMINRLDGSSPVYHLDPVAGYADSVIAILAPFDSLRVWKKENIPSEFVYGSNPRIAELLILADSGRVLGTRPGRGSYAGGDHGFDPAMDDMHSLMVARGPGFKKGAMTEKLYNVDIYNMICHLLGIVPAPNDGEMERVKVLLK